MDDHIEQTEHLRKNRNNKAAMLIIEAIAKYPQNDDGAPVLIAESILHNIMNIRPDKTMGISDIANIDYATDDAKSWKEKINAIHRAYGIHKVVSLEEAKGFIYQFAVFGLNELRDEIINLAKEKQITLPEKITSSSVYTRQLDNINFKIESPVALAMESFLMTHNDKSFMIELLERITKKADKIRSGSKAQQDKHSRK